MVLTTNWSERFADLKREIVAATPDYERRLTQSWNDLLQELDERTTEIVDEGSNVGHLRFLTYKALIVP